jgi:hypothetical protein
MGFITGCRKMKKITHFCLWVALIVSPCLVYGADGSATLSWKGSPAADVVGYKVYCGEESRVYGQGIPVGNSNSFTMTGLDEGKIYYFALTAVDAAGNESGYSSEVKKVIPKTCGYPIPLPATDTFGNLMDTDNPVQKEGVSFSFAGVKGDVVIKYEVYDIDGPRELRIFVNGVKIGCAPTTKNRSWSGQKIMTISDEYVNDSEQNLLTFNHIYNIIKNPAKKSLWRVRNVSIGSLNDAVIPLPASGTYGKVVNGNPGHVDKVLFNFPGKAGDVLVSYEAYDIDWEGEVRVMVNGKKVGYLPATGSNTWGEERTVMIPDRLVADGGDNIITFDHTRNPTHKWLWAIRNVRLR